MERFNVTIKNVNSKDKVNFEAKATEIGANDLQDFARTLAKFVKKTQVHFETLQSYGVKGLNQSKVKKTGKMIFTVEWLGDQITFEISYKDFGKTVSDLNEDQVAEIISLSLEYQTEIGFLFDRK